MIIKTNTNLSKILVMKKLINYYLLFITYTKLSNILIIKYNFKKYSQVFILLFKLFTLNNKINKRINCDKHLQILKKWSYFKNN